MSDQSEPRNLDKEIKSFERKQCLMTILDNLFSLAISVVPLGLLFYFWRDGFFLFIALGSAIGIPLVMWMGKQERDEKYEEREQNRLAKIKNFDSEENYTERRKDKIIQERR